MFFYTVITMNIFSEICGAYFRTAAALLSQRGKPLTEADFYRAVERHGFRDSALFLPKKLLPQKDSSDWGLFKKTDGGFVPITKNPPPDILSELQRSWLKALLSDPRITLFLSDEEMIGLSEKLKDTQPLYRSRHFRSFDRYSDGDEFQNRKYRENFRMILSAEKSHEALRISYPTKSGGVINAVILPLKLEYSAKNDKFRVFCRTVNNGNLRGYMTINAGRIISVEPTGKRFTKTVSNAAAMNKFFSDRRAPEPVTVYVKPERNAPERFLMEFANYEKRTERDPEDGSLTVNIYYDRADETELLILLLSYGAAVEILAPKYFREQAAQRVKKQAELLSQFSQEQHFEILFK